METSVRSLDAHLRRLVHLGADVNGRPVYLPLDAFRGTGTHIVGAAGYGKSFFLRNLIRHFVRFGQPFGVIDPHKELVSYALSIVRRSGVRRDRVVVIDPGDMQHSVAFNPLNCGVPDHGDASSLVLEAVLKAWGASNFDQTPRLENLLRSTFRLLLDNDLSLLEGPDVLDPDNTDLRRALRERVTDAWVREEWIAFDKWPRSERIAIAESTRLRLRRFLQSDAVRRMLGQCRQTLDLRRLMDEGGILLADIGNTATPETKRLLGALLVNGIYHAAKHRNPRHRRDFFLIVDECGQFATQDLANSLDELRKFGVHLILAHQRLRQLEREDADVLSAVMTNAKVKVIFGGLERPEAERMARELYTGEVTGDQVKHVTLQTKFRPVPDWVTVESESWSETDGESDSASFSQNESEVSGLSEGVVYGRDDDGNLGYGDNYIIDRSVSETSSRSDGHSRSSSHVSQHSSTSGGSRSTVPITRHEEFREETSRQFRSIDEEWENRVGRVHRLDKRHALVRVHNGAVLQIRTADVSHASREREITSFKNRLAAISPHVVPAAAAMQEIEERRRSLKTLVDDAQEAERPRVPRSFRQ